MKSRMESILYQSTRIVMFPVLWLYLEIREWVQRWKRRQDIWPIGGFKS